MVVHCGHATYKIDQLETYEHVFDQVVVVDMFLIWLQCATAVGISY